MRLIYSAGFISFYLLFCTACTSTKQIAANSSNGDLLFQSGFEGNVKVIQYKRTASDKIIGTDITLKEKSNWIADLDSALCNKKEVTINYTGGDSSKRYARIIPEPSNPRNKVLKYWLNETWVASEGERKGRVQVDLYNIKGGLKEFYQSVRVYLHPDFNTVKNYPQPIKWLTIAEFWNNEWWVPTEKHGFRITLGIGKATAQSSDLNFIVDAQDPGFKEVWNAGNTNVIVPIGKWFTLEYYFKEGNKETGRFYAAITPDGGKKQVICDVHDFTHNTTDTAPNGLTGYNPMKLYTSKELVAYMKSEGKTLQIYWDDLKIWKDKQPRK
jgi:hypothetical protein